MKVFIAVVLIAVVLINCCAAQVVYPGGGATGSRCTTRSRESGTCRKFLDCQAARDDIENGIYPTICNFGSGTISSIVICCPERDTPNPNTDHFAKFADVCGRVSSVLGNRLPQATSTPLPNLLKSSTRKLIKATLRPLRPIQRPSRPNRKLSRVRPQSELALHRLTKRSPTELQLNLPSLEQFFALHKAQGTTERSFAIPGKNTTPRYVVGGQNAQRKAWPWMALLGERRGADYDWFCGGSLITDEHILTAAHCFSQGRRLDVVRLGEHDLSKVFESSHIDVQVKNVFSHPGFSAPKVENDIAIVKFRSPVTFSDYVRPICMPLSDFTPASVGFRGTIAGWGTLSFGGRSSDILQEVSVPVVDKQACEAAYRTSFSYKRNFPDGFPHNLFCASEEQGGKDACQGDSGGPFMMEDGGRFRVTGVVSAGQGCGSKTFPGLYTWVFPYLQWMQETVQK